MSYSKEHIAAMAKAGYVLGASGKFVKDEPAVTVDRNGDVIDTTPRSQSSTAPEVYQPKFHDNQQIREQPRQEVNASRPRNIYMELMQQERDKQAEIARRQAAKAEMKFMGKDECKQFVNDEGLNANLTLEEQHLMHKIMGQHRQAKQEVLQQQQAAIRTFGGARATLLKTVSEMSPAEIEELRQLLKVKENVQE